MQRWLGDCLSSELFRDNGREWRVLQKTTTIKPFAPTDLLYILCPVPATQAWTLLWIVVRVWTLQWLSCNNAATLFDGGESEDFLGGE